MRNHELSTNGITVNYNHKTDLSRGPKQRIKIDTRSKNKKDENH